MLLVRFLLFENDFSLRARDQNSKFHEKENESKNKDSEHISDTPRIYIEFIVIFIKMIIISDTRIYIELILIFTKMVIISYQFFP